MRKFLLITAMLFAGTLLMAGRVEAAENWRLSGNYTITFTCTSGCGGDYIHTMNVSVYDLDDGEFSGTGYYNATPSITWTVAGDIDGDTLDFLVDYNGSAYYVDAIGTIASDGAMSGTAVSSSQAFNWVISPKATFNRYAEITSPAVGSTVETTLDLGAFLMDDDYDPVQWAVRRGTCAAATNTVLGNVDGRSDYFTWVADGVVDYKYNFAASADVSAWVEGSYCFIFNPTEDAGEAGVRETEFFLINDPDDDDDGVLDGEDFCPETTADDSWEVNWGTNRWQVQGDFRWWQNKPGKRGVMAPTPVYELEYTHGCNGHQILELLQEELGSVMLGHWKFGLSSSVLDEFHWDLMDGVLDGIYLIETVTVPANRTTPTVSSYSLESGMDYKLVARGTASAGDGITFDARYSFRSGSSTIWTDSVSTYESYGVGLLDLFLDGSTPWGDYSSIHEYEYYMVGSGLQISLLINDVYYPNNTGNLYVDIYADL